MKRQIRQGVFETNSSSEHSISIVNSKDFQAWKEGKVYARQLPGSEEYKNTWGNFWSQLDHWEFKEMTAEEAEKENRRLFDEYIQKKKTDIELYRKHMEDVKSWKTGECEYFEDDVSKSKWMEKQKLHLEEQSRNIEKMAFENFSATRKFYNNFYISYEEYIDALRNGDCYSPFEHTQGDVSVFGIYYHS